MKTTSKLGKPTLSSLVEEFMESCAHLSPKTLSSYRMSLKNLEWYAHQNRWPANASNITRTHIREFLAYVGNEGNRWGYTDPSLASAHPASRSTVHRYGRVIKTMFRWATEEEQYLKENPTQRLKLGSPQYGEITPYRDDEVYAMLNLCHDEARYRGRYRGIRNKAIISLFVATGLRLEELRSIRIPNMDPRLQQVQVKGKGGKFRIVPIDGEARKALRHYLEIRPDGGDELWKTEDGEVMSVNAIRIMIVRLKEMAGINGQQSQCRGGAHRFRHYFATRFLEAGGDLNSLRLLLGHSTLNMVLRYSRFVDIQAALTQHRQFNPLDRLYRGQNHHRGDAGWGHYGQGR